MTVPSLAGAPWLAAPATQRLLALLSEDGDEARIVGGAPRDALLGVAVGDLDIATTALPELVMRRAAAAGFGIAPTGLEHGTVTVIVEGQPFEVTTLRTDVSTDGRRATVAFGRDWLADALRRDFTINALSVCADGTVHDPVGGLADLARRRVRFIGDAETRIREDSLRILRFFRFHARIAEGEPDADGLRAAMRLRQGLRTLSRERVGQEMRRLVLAPGAAAALVTMTDAGILGIALGLVPELARFARHARLAAATGRTAAATGLAALGVRVAEDATTLAERLRLSRAETARMHLLPDAAAATLAEGPAGDRARRYRLGAESYRDAVLFAWACARDPVDDAGWRARLALAESFQPVLPISGRDVVAAGIAPGPEVGRALAEAERLWIASDFSLDRAALVALATTG